MESLEDLLDLMNDVKKIIYGEDVAPFKLHQLTWFSNPNLGGTRYIDFEIKKKSGSNRTIHAPVRGLKAIQTVLNVILSSVFIPHKSVMGFVPDKSIVDNAKVHTNQLYVYNIDLKDFFPSVDQARVWKCLQLHPFNLGSTIPKKTKVSFDDGLMISLSNNFNEIANSYLIYCSDLKYGVHRIRINDDVTVTYKVNKHVKLKYAVEYRAFIKVLKDDYTDINPDDIHEIIFYGSYNNNLYIQNEALSIVEKMKGEIDQERACHYVINQLFNNHQKSLDNTYNKKKLVNVIASLCCTKMNVERLNNEGTWEIQERNVLPQGAPTSPILTNIVCQRLDYLLSAVAKRFGLKYSRYADDITFSSMHNVYQTDSEFLKELRRIIQNQNFHIKESKTRLQKEGYRKEVTGLLVNEKANVHKRYIKQLRMWLYYWERYGYDRASSFFLQHYIADKGHVKKGNPDMANVISGKLDYLKMVKGEGNELYQKLKARLDKISGKVESEPNKLIQVENSDGGNAFFKKLMFRFPEQQKEVLDEKINNIFNMTKIEEKPKPVFHKPKELVSLLKNFSVNDSALKYTTHSWDAGRDANMFKDLSEFLLIAKSQYNEFSFALKTLSENLNGKIYNFLFNKEIAKSGWGDINPKKRIYFGWSSPELLEACNKDISLNPEDFILPEKYQVQRAGKTLQKFKHIIDVFKNEIEVRDENSALLNLILQKHDYYLISFSAPKVSNLENKTFYTDIQWLGKSLDLIFEGIQKYPQHPVVEYAVTESNNDRLILTILHLNSFKNGLSIHDDKLNLKRGDFSTIKDKLKNLCDWSIESEFAEGAYRINYLVSDSEIPAYEKIMSAEGFKHILTFYK